MPDEWITIPGTNIEFQKPDLITGLMMLSILTILFAGICTYVWLNRMEILWATFVYVVIIFILCGDGFDEYGRPL